METLRIRKFQARYRLPASAREMRRRLDAALKKTIDETLEGELARLGFSDGEEVCIRDVFVPVRLRLSATVDALAQAWGSALAEAIRHAAGGSRVAGVVRYESRIQGLVDMAVGVTLNDLARVWAWRQLGLWRAGERVSETDALDELIRALVTEPATIMPVVLILAERGMLQRLAPRLTHEHWWALAEAALSVAGGSELLNQSSSESLNQSPSAPPATISATTMREASRLLSSSRIARVHAWTLAQSAARHAEIQRAVAVMVVLESSQSALSRGEEEARLLVNAVVRALRSPADALSLRRTEGAAAAEAEREGMRPPASVEFENRREVEASDERASVVLTELNAASAASGGERETRRVTGGQENIFEAAAHDDERPLPVVRRRAFTRFGGLLFLLGLMEDLGLPEEMSAYAALSERPFRWVLHRVALALAPVAEDDAVALAFAGLPPDARPPSVGEDEPSESESGVIASYAARITEELGIRLNEWRDEPPASLLQFVSRRRAEIVADPGWFEVRLSLDEVATEIRRAGLDLDPGYLRWLGAVVKFVYE